MPRRLYGISKLASELITERYGDLFGLSTASVRPSSVYGTMDRVTTSRNFRHVPTALPTWHSMGSGACASIRSMRVGDYIHVRGCRARHRLSAARAAPALQCLQRRVRCDRDDRRYGRMGGGKGAGLSRRDRASRGGRHPAGRHPQRRHVGCLRYLASSAPRPAGSRDPMREALHAYMDWIAAERDAGPQREAR